jgi:hypothetical protein
MKEIGLESIFWFRIRHILVMMVELQVPQEIIMGFISGYLYENNVINHIKLSEAYSLFNHPGYTKKEKLFYCKSFPKFLHELPLTCDEVNYPKNLPEINNLKERCNSQEPVNFIMSFTDFNDPCFYC